jgi:hypothetical protein
MIAASGGGREREKNRSAFNLEPPIAGHQSFPKRFDGHGASRLCPPTLAHPMLASSSSLVGVACAPSCPSQDAPAP